ncbi:MAG TPA: dienelactone hydrolase family protein, partial [Candidatus Limnocylindrales bacterium]
AADELSSNAARVEVERLIAAGLGRLRADEGEVGRGIGIVAFSFGCGFALELAAAGNDVDAVVLHYGTGGELDWSRTRAAFLGHFAADDPFEPPDAVEALRAALERAGRDVRFETYPGAKHWFAEPDRPEHDERAAGVAWDRTVAFLRENLGPLGA